MLECMVSMQPGYDYIMDPDESTMTLYYLLKDTDLLHKIIFYS